MTNETYYESSRRTGTHQHPWRRYWAKLIDLGVTAVLFGLFFNLLLPASPIVKHRAFALIYAALLIPLDALLLCNFGTSLGRYLLGVRVTKDSVKPTLVISLRRSILVWFKGLGMGFPLFTVFTCIAAYKRLMREGSTSWDKSQGTEVTYISLSTMKVSLAVLLIALKFGILVWGKTHEDSTPNGIQWTNPLTHKTIGLPNGVTVVTDTKVVNGTVIGAFFTEPEKLFIRFAYEDMQGDGSGIEIDRIAPMFRAEEAKKFNGEVIFSDLDYSKHSDQFVAEFSGKLRSPYRIRFHIWSEKLRIWKMISTEIPNDANVDILRAEVLDSLIGSTQN